MIAIALLFSRMLRDCFKSRSRLEAEIVALRSKCCTAPSWQGESSRRIAGRCSHVFGLLARFTWPLAIMPSADQGPVKTSHSRMQWHEWVVLIAGSTGFALRAVRPPNLHITPDVGAI